MPSAGRGDRLVAAPAEDKPVDLAIEHAPDHVFADAIAAIDLALRPQIVADAAGGDLGHELRGSRDVVVIVDASLATAIRSNDQVCVGLGLVVQVQADAAVVAGLDAGGLRIIEAQPG